MSFPNDETGAVLAEMQDAGIELSKPVIVEFFQLFEDENNARALADYIKNSDIDAIVKVHPDQTPNVWDVDCTMKMIPSYENITKNEVMFEKLARRFSGYNDGWGVQLDD